ncbi:hypothetical protein [Rhodopirellula baltica]|uniref:Uncharacterized protein n=1 Tax=Rhodopirellula baltica SWK14 TaxID=993516 RepID=L7CJX4_RHOBT|nr:hypothetical protein [Rhodopirellula baltica]ELP34554.1 hypothetical protein RBSWK_01564 [Rhodopirellula baltica SWK14]
MSTKPKRPSRVREAAPAYKTEKKTTEAATQTIVVEVNHEGQLYLAQGQKRTVAAQWLMDASDGHLGQGFRQLGTLLRMLARYAGFATKRTQKIELRVLHANLANEKAARVRFVQQVFTLIAAFIAQIECSALVVGELSADDRKRYAVSAGRRAGVFLPALKSSCAENVFTLTINLEGVSDETQKITPRVIGGNLTSDAFADAAQDASLAQVLASLEWDHLAALKAHLEEAEQLKAAEELLEGKRLTVANVNRLLANTDRAFNNEEKENLVRVVRFFENREKQVHVQEGDESIPARFNIQPRSDASTLVFDVDARKEGGRRIMRSALPEGLRLG